MMAYPGNSLVSNILAAVKISAVYSALTGTPPRRCGTNRFRGQAAWRGGENPSVALDDSKSTWFDHAASEGGGVLDLVARVKGGDRRESLHWLCEFNARPRIFSLPMQTFEDREYRPRRIPALRISANATMPFVPDSFGPTGRSSLLVLHA